MRYNNLTVLQSEQDFSWDGFCFPDFISPSVHKGEMRQTHRFFPSSGKSYISLQLNIEGAENVCRADLADAQKKCCVNNDKFPYLQTADQWWGYCTAPHNYIPLGNGLVQVGLNYFNRFLHIDFKSRSARLADPGVGNAMLSTTNFFDQKTGDLWFASWSFEDTVRRILNPEDNVLVTIWKFSMAGGKVERVWQGDFADSLHHLSLSTDSRFLILTELGLWPEEDVCAKFQGNALLLSGHKPERGLIPSKILVLDLKTGGEWRLPMLTAGHVEFDPVDQDICFLSGHNIGLIGVKVGIFGPGVIKKIRLTSAGPKLAGEFSHPQFHRITTHILFRHRGKTLIGVSGYPNKVFVIDAATMELYKVIELESGDEVDTSNPPHLCQQDSYGIAASKDGEAILAAGTGFINIALIAEGKFSLKKEIKDYTSNSCFTGHLGFIK